MTDPAARCPVAADPVTLEAMGEQGVAVGQPHRALRRYVREYVGYRHVTGVPDVHHGVPGPSATVILAFDDPIDVAWKDDPASRAAYWTMASGLHTRPALVHTGGAQHGIQLQLTPLGVRALLGIPVGALATAMVAHEELPLGIDATVHARVAAAATWAQRFAILDATLLGALSASGEARVAAVSPAARDGWRALAAARGGLGVRELAAATGWSARHLHARFVAEFGIAPKQAAQLMRFDRARGMVRRGLALAEAAAASGYADQAHLTREWTRFAGQPPRRTLAELAQFEDR